MKSKTDTLDLSKLPDEAKREITIETIYKKVIDLQRDVAQIKKSLIEEPELRQDFILRMRDIDLERAIMVEDFSKRYGLK